jgi:hypothetical protein
MKMQKVKVLVQEHIKANYNTDTWVYIDYIRDGRFESSVLQDKEIDLTMETEDIAEYIIDKLDKNYSDSCMFF